MRQTLTEGAQDWVTMALTGLGVSLAPHEYFGGLFLALAVASLLARHRRDPRKVWAALCTAAIFATLTAAVWDWSNFDFAPVQLVMAVAGVLGRPAATILVALQDRLEARGTEIADMAIDHVLREQMPDADHGPGASPPLRAPEVSAPPPKT